MNRHEWFYRLWALAFGIVLMIAVYERAQHREHHEKPTVKQEIRR